MTNERVCPECGCKLTSAVYVEDAYYVVVFVCPYHGETETIATLV